MANIASPKVVSVEEPAAVPSASDVLGLPGEFAARRLKDARGRLRDLQRTGCGENVYLAVGNLGIGLFARIPIFSGAVILELRGPLIGFDAAVAKGDWQCYPLQVGPGTYIDLEEPGCFANHSCRPNAGARGTLLIAIRDIAAGDEIRYDYSTTMDEDYWTMPCRCGDPGCRGVVTDFKDLPGALRNYYLSIGVVQPFIATQFER